MSDIGTINMFISLFPHKTLPKIQGKPDYKLLKHLKDCLKANASKITSDLGGGAHGHLGLVLPPLEYTHVFSVPYAQHPHP